MDKASFKVMKEKNNFLAIICVSTCELQLIKQYFYLSLSMLSKTSFISIATLFFPIKILSKFGSSLKIIFVGYFPQCNASNGDKNHDFLWKVEIKKENDVFRCKRGQQI